MEQNATAVVKVQKDSGMTAIKALVLDSVHSGHSRRAYDKALTDFLAWHQAEGGGGFTKAVVQKYAVHLQGQGRAASTINLRLTAVRRLAVEAADNGLIDSVLADGIGRVKGVKQAGTKLGNWLTAGQAEQLVNHPDAATLKGRRDRALLAVMIGCGLRRSEASYLSFDHIQQRESRWVLADLLGKGGRVRTVPMPTWTKVAVDQWAEASGLGAGRVFRPVLKGGRVSGQRLDPHNIMQIVSAYGTKIGVPALAPHDLRRTFAKLAHKGRAPLEQIQLSLGHSSIMTTERYLGVKQDLQDAPCDHLGLNFGAT
jgi:integrase